MTDRSLVVLLIFLSCAKCMPLQPPVNEDYIGKNVTCTPTQKLCIIYGRIFNEYDGKCYPMERKGPCPENCLFFLDKDAVLKYGKYVGKCVFDDKWPKPWFETEEDGRHVLVTNDCTSIERNIFGEYICFQNVLSRIKVEVRQPQEEGQCRIPDLLNFPGLHHLLYSSMHDVLSKYPCTISEYRCLVDKKIYWPQDGQCYDPLSTEPCAEGEWLLLDEERFLLDDTIVTPVCRPMPCARNEVLMNFDRKCYQKKEILSALCFNSRVVVTNIFGRSGCRNNVIKPTASEPSFDPASGKCYIPRQYGGGVGNFGSRLCSPTNLGVCPRKVGLKPGPI